ncbi:hypothetical protein ILYODFUR_017480 [Ilyodon furcidens]|uniref:Uncharacterized protein n=1 Tax=Ilyodon furcidens TaxID=33524 RepID=A0ABV0V5V7_9TELE
MKTMLRILLNVLHVIMNSYCTMISRGVHRREPVFFGSDAATPVDDGRRYHTLHNRLIEDMQHLAANTERPQLPQEVQNVLSLLVDGFTVAPPLQSVVQVNTKVFILLHHLHFSSHYGNSL